MLCGSTRSRKGQMLGRHKRGGLYNLAHLECPQVSMKLEMSQKIIPEHSKDKHVSHQESAPQKKATIETVAENSFRPRLCCSQAHVEELWQDMLSFDWDLSGNSADGERRKRQKYSS